MRGWFGRFGLSHSRCPRSFSYFPNFRFAGALLLGGYGCSKRDCQIGLRHHLAHVSVFFLL